ncbi:hypothetical protein CLAIMM_13771 [Cladophialophora immunda]|nr:hypothetical protein CLAIMM_13771 [Cladophialophora immunda]
MDWQVLQQRASIADGKESRRRHRLSESGGGTSARKAHKWSSSPSIYLISCSHLTGRPPALSELMVDSTYYQFSCKYNQMTTASRPRFVVVCNLGPCELRPCQLRLCGPLCIDFQFGSGLSDSWRYGCRFWARRAKVPVQGAQAPERSLLLLMLGFDFFKLIDREGSLQSIRGNGKTELRQLIEPRPPETASWSRNLALSCYAGAC